jgi:hypothetical protein
MVRQNIKLAVLTLTATIFSQLTFLQQMVTSDMAME